MAYYVLKYLGTHLPKQAGFHQGASSIGLRPDRQAVPCTLPLSRYNFCQTVVSGYNRDDVPTVHGHLPNGLA